MDGRTRPSRVHKSESRLLPHQLHPYNVQKHLVNFCQKKGIAVTAYSSFVSCSIHPRSSMGVAY